jgi:hypothetical protein
MKKKPFPPCRRIAAVWWKDACSYGHRNLKKDDFDEPKARSVMILSAGIVLKDDEEGMTLVLNESNIPLLDKSEKPEIDFDFAICIPREYIKKKKYLK